jgi:hypothetical protein
LLGLSLSIDHALLPWWQITTSGATPGRLIVAGNIFWALTEWVVEDQDSIWQ